MSDKHMCLDEVRCSRLAIRAGLDFPLSRGISLAVMGDTDGSARRIVMEPPTFTEVEAGLCVTPQFSLSMETSQVLMDDLWLCGIRPTEGAGTAGSMAAVQHHLTDMRAIAFRKLGVQLPEAAR